MDLTVLLTMVLALGVLGAIIYVVPYIKKIAAKENIDINDTLQTTKKLIELIQLLLKNTNMLPTEQKIFIEKIAEASQLAVRYAEQLYKSGQCKKDERKDKAIEFVKQILIESGIEITADKLDIISKTIEAAVFLLPKL